MPNLQAFTVKSTGFLQVHNGWKLLQYFIDFWISGERSNFWFLDWLPRRCPIVKRRPLLLLSHSHWMDQNPERKSKKLFAPDRLGTRVTLSEKLSQETLRMKKLLWPGMKFKPSKRIGARIGIQWISQPPGSFRRLWMTVGWVPFAVTFACCYVWLDWFWSPFWSFSFCGF